MIDTERKEDLFLDTKLIKSENRLGKLRIIDELHPVLGGQPTHEKDQPNDNNPFLDLACTMQFTIDKVNAVDKKADTKLAKAQNLKDVANVAIARDNLGLGTSATMNATSTLSDRTDQTAAIKVVNDVNRAASTAQKTANNAHALAQSKQDKLDFIGDGPEVMKTGAFGWGVESFRGWDLNLSHKSSIQAVNLKTENTPPGIVGSVLNLAYANKLYTSKILIDVVKPKVFIFGGKVEDLESGVQEWYELYHTANTTPDKSGFLRASGNANALVESDVTNSLGNSKSLVASQALVNSINSKIKPNTSSKNQNGWWKCGDTGLIYQWGKGWSSGSDDQTQGTMTFPIAFPNAVLNIQALHGKGTAAGCFVVTSFSNQIFNILSDTRSVEIWWLAIGY